MQKHFLAPWAIALMPLILLGALFPTYAADPPGNLTEAQVKVLKKVGIAIAIPRYLAPGFQVAKVTTVPCLPHAKPDAKRSICTGPDYAEAYRRANKACNYQADCVGPIYRVLYRHADNTCFSVYGQYTIGIGGGAGDFAFPVETALLGKTAIGFGRGRSVADQPASPQQLKTPQPNLQSFPMYQPGTPNIYGIRMVEKGDGCGSNRRITPLTMEKILKSLSWL